MTYDRIFFIILITLQLCKGQIVFRNNEGYDFTEPLVKTTVYSQFNDCTTCKHYYTANFKKDDHIFVQVFVPQALLMSLLLLNDRTSDYPKLRCLYIGFCKFSSTQKYF